MALELMISTIPTTFSKTMPSFLQLSEECKNNHDEDSYNLMYNFGSVCRQLTYNDGVNFALNLQGDVVTVEDVNHLFQLRLFDHQIVFLLKVFLQQEGNRFDLD